MRGDQVHDPLLHMRPDRGLRLEAGADPAAITVMRGRGLGQLGHVRDGHGDGDVPGLVRRRGHHLNRLDAAQEPGHLGPRLHRGREPDPLGGLRQQGVEPFEADRQVCAALGAGHGVHLVHDHRLHPRQGGPGLGGEHQVQRLGRGDQDVRRVGEQLAALAGGGVAGADAHTHVRGILTAAPGGLGDPDQRGAQVPFHVHAERLERGDVEDPGGGTGSLGTNPVAVLRLLRALPGRLPRLVLPYGRLPQETVQRPQERGERLA